MESLPQRSFQLAASYAAFGGDAVVDEKDGDTPVVEVVQPVVGVDVSQLGLMAEGAEEAESFVTEVAALPGDEDQPHLMVALRSPGRRPRRLARQPEGLPHLDRWPGQAVGLLDVVDTDPHIIRRIMLHGDRPQRVARLDDHRRVARRGAAVRPQGEPDPEQRNGGDCRQQSPHRRKAAGTGCPPRFDPVTSGVHTFGSIPNGRSPVKTPNKGLRVEARSASMASALPHHALEMNTN